jgi:predicted anti-sigma-YlaC factor YlaD
MAGSKNFKGKIKRDVKRLKREENIMLCHKIQKYLVAYVDDELDYILKEKIKHHLEECPQCQAQLEETKKMLYLYKSMPELKPQAGDIERIMETVTSVRGDQKKTRIVSKLVEWFVLQNRTVRWATAGVIVIIFVLLGTFIPRYFLSKKESLLGKSATVYTYHEYVAKEKPNETRPKFGKYSFISIY